jgi:hypothetical protein
MRGMTLRWVAGFRMMLAVGLSVAALGSPAAQETAPAGGVGQAEVPIEELEELDEVVVRGERLRDTIIKAEDEFYKLYNQLNKNDKYDVSCPYLNLSNDSGSRINSRLCLPGFVATAISDFTVYKMSCEPTFANFDTNRDGRISRTEGRMNPDLDSQFDELDQDDDSHLDQYGEFRTFETWALMNLNCYRPPTPELVLMEGTDKWYAHMMQVIKSDPRLQDMAGRLDGLHMEMQSVQRRYQQVTDEQKAAGVSNAPDMSKTGPRTR